MIRYLLFLTRKKPAYGKYNFEQKFTYWFLFLWHWHPGDYPGLFSGSPESSPASFRGESSRQPVLAHSNEAVVAAVFICDLAFLPRAPGTPEPEHLYRAAE